MVALGYVGAFLLLDWVSYIRPFEGLNVTPWNPQPALAIALLLRFPRWVGLVWLSLLTAELAVRGIPADWFVALAATGALALSYAAIARVLHVRLERTLSLVSRRDLLWFTTIVIAGTLLSATVYVGTFAVAGRMPSSTPVLEAILRYSIGDAVGVVVVLPILLALLNGQRRIALAQTARSGEWWLAAALAVVLLVVVFGQSDRDHFKFFYLLFLPVVWASSRFGLSGAVLAAAVIQVGLIVAVQSLPNSDLTVFELQALMGAAAMTGLVLGVAVDERERAAHELKGSLRLAAAGQMAAALAHELTQPLTALNNYAQAATILRSSTDMAEAERSARLAEVAERMSADAVRASDVVKRLREFFRFGSTHLQSVDLQKLLREAVAASAKRADAIGIRIQCETPEGLPIVLADNVQVSVVIRNLVANALDAAANQPGGQVTLSAR
jgi:signal transduction histidine kinase